MGVGGPREGVHGKARHPQLDLVEGDTLLLARLRGEYAIQRLHTTIGICQERVSLEPLTGLSLRWGGSCLG